MKKGTTPVFCKNCKYFSDITDCWGGHKYYTCSASKIYGKPIKVKSTPLSEAYTKLPWWKDAEIEKLNKNNNCPYYKERLIVYLLRKINSCKK